MTIHAHLTYLQKNRFANRQIETPPAKPLKMVVVIPCHDEPDLPGALQSLADCQAPNGGVEVIVVINSGENDPESVKKQNLKTLIDAKSWIQDQAPDWLPVHLIHFPELAKKHAGVGLARKIGMDEAVDRLLQADEPQGIIVCYDADCRCAPNYLQAIEEGFALNPKGPACSIYYEHPTQGPLDSALYQGIIKYELYLRYYIQGLRFAKYPYNFHTIGSSMAVRADAYQKQGGMNRRKAGEDFYFLHKFMPLGHFFEINNTKVIPSPRTSERVPFGTGKAMGDWLESEQDDYKVYDFRSFQDLRKFVQKCSEELYQCPIENLDDLLKTFPESFQAFLQNQNFGKVVQEAKKQSGNEITFKKRFFQWFNGLKVLKYVHFARDNFYSEKPVAIAASELLMEIEIDTPQGEMEILEAYRKLDRKGLPV